VPVELDGEPVGTLPLEIEVLPQALRIVCPPKA
jgi:diacylglycerol kinase family enzyme